MTPNIEKLDKLLKKDFHTESDFVYMLILIRKELELLAKLNLENDNFGYVKFFCDWALHMRIDHSNVGSLLVTSIHKTLDDQKHGHTDDLIQKISSCHLSRVTSENS